MISVKLAEITNASLTFVYILLIIMFYILTDLTEQIFLKVLRAVNNSKGCGVREGFMLTVAIDQTAGQEVSSSALAQFPSLPAHFCVFLSSFWNDIKASWLTDSQNVLFIYHFALNLCLDKKVFINPCYLNLTNCLLVWSWYVCLCLCRMVIPQHFTLFTALQKGANDPWYDISCF